MRYKNKIASFLIGCFLLLSQLLLAQTFIAGDQITLNVNEYSLIETNHAPVTLTLSSSVAGAPLTQVSNSSMFLKLSSITPGGTSRRTTVRISSGSVPSGTTLRLAVASCTITNSGGNLGTPGSPITLSSTDQSIITGIGTCYTGTGYNDGYRLTYTWIPTTVPSNYNLIAATLTPVNITVVFTISAHAGGN